MKKTLLIFVAFFLSFSQANAFLDTESRAVDRLVEDGVIKQKDRFLPELKCTRAQFVVWALRNIGEDPEGKNISEPFFDISDEPYAPFVATAWKMGAVPTDTIFSPREPISKIDALTIALKLEQKSIPISGFTLKYVDAPDDTEGKGVVRQSINMRIVQPINNKVFGTNTLLTRYECAKILDAISIRRASGLGEEKRSELKPKEEVFDAIWNALQTKYLHAEDIDSEELMETVIHKTIESIGDEYTVYFNKQEVETFLTGVGEATQYGIGAQVGLDQSGRVQVVKPLKDSQAQKAGLRPGDVFLEVDGENVAGGDMTLEEVVALIKGEEGTPVKLKMQRRTREIEVVIIRGPIQLQAVTPHLYDQYLVLEVDFFGNNTVEGVAKAIEEYSQQAKNGVILDLRNNPGGYLEEAIDFLARLLPEGSVAVKTRGRDIVHTETVRGPADMVDFPLVILVNERSASASEIVAGAVQDLKRGSVIGTKTFGKGTAQELMQFSDGSALKMTIAEWLTPNDRSIEGVGITPDYPFQDADDAAEMWEYAAKIIKRGQWK